MTITRRHFTIYICLLISISRNDLKTVADNVSTEKQATGNLGGAQSTAMASIDGTWLLELLQNVRNLLQDTGPRSVCGNGGESLDILVKGVVTNYLPQMIGRFKGGTNGSKELSGMVLPFLDNLAYLRKQVCENREMIDMAFKWLIKFIVSAINGPLSALRAPLNSPQIIEPPIIEPPTIPSRQTPSSMPTEAPVLVDEAIDKQAIAPDRDHSHFIPALPGLSSQKVNAAPSPVLLQSQATNPPVSYYYVKIPPRTNNQ